MIWINQAIAAYVTVEPVDRASQKSFRLLSREEFSKLSCEEKVAYLSRAIDAVEPQARLIGVVAKRRHASDA
ncbi:MAG TPA: hypothetical protein VFT23_15030 [Burkholderiales bacterium]|nr:hypothetical protein [Burkholderiales bacterium]